MADIAAAHAALKSRGVEFSAAPHMVHRHPDGTEEWLATFADPEGRPLMLMSQVSADAKAAAPASAPPRAR